MASLVLCSVFDAGGVPAEIRRVLKPGGEPRFFEHVRSNHLVFCMLHDAITPLWGGHQKHCGGATITFDSLPTPEIDMSAPCGWILPRSWSDIRHCMWAMVNLLCMYVVSV